jgi:tRNA dimethylallyltransferase
MTFFLKKQKIVVIIGQTSSGKSDLAVEIALKHNGEIISADSRQIYRGLDIGTGKITKEEMRGVQHHLLDIIDPKETFTASDFKDKAEEAILNITTKNKLPIIAGGTGFYIDFLFGNSSSPNIKPNPQLREKLEQKDITELQIRLKQLAPRRYKTIEKENPRRLIRAIEIALATKKNSPTTTIINILRQINLVPPALSYDVLWLGIRNDDTELLRKRIDARNKKMLDTGLLDEVQTLLDNNLSQKRFNELGFEYIYAKQFLEGKITKEECLELMNNKTWQYAKRQKTYWKRNREIKWFGVEERDKIEEVIQKFLN